MRAIRHIVEGREVLAVEAGQTVLDAVSYMTERVIGAVPVLENGCVVGMFTERDVLTRVVVQQKDPAKSSVSDVMTAEVAFCRPDDDLDNVAAMMRERRIRHLPVCDEDGQLRGLISIGDVNAWRAQGQDVTISYLHEYIYGRM